MSKAAAIINALRPKVRRLKNISKWSRVNESIVRILGAYGDMGAYASEIRLILIMEYGDMTSSMLNQALDNLKRYGFVESYYDENKRTTWRLTSRGVAIFDGRDQTP